jgi:hypothetical protein
VADLVDGKGSLPDHKYDRGLDHRVPTLGDDALWVSPILYDRKKFGFQVLSRSAVLGTFWFASESEARLAAEEMSYVIPACLEIENRRNVGRRRPSLAQRDSRYAVSSSHKWPREEK